ncbi:MAG: hypothetical protein HY907_14860 [Deltaproteobacteria bacterium]|nr:hypothetical protein [Deltaproteobacteria bacterium]
MPERQETGTRDFPRSARSTGRAFRRSSPGNIQNGLQRLGSCDPSAPLPQDRCDPGLGPLPREGGLDSGCPLDALGRCVPAAHVRPPSSPAPHALYAATGVDGDTLRAYYDAAGNMMALVVHRPGGCGREDDTDPNLPASGGPDGSGCREGADFRLLFAWDEVGNMLAVERQRLVPRWSCDTAGGGIAIQSPDREEYLGPDGEDGRATHEWCAVARVESGYDFGGQRRVKHEATLILEERDRWPAGYSLYVSPSFEVREARREFGTYGGGLDARYLWNEAGILFELDADVSTQGALVPQSRLTLTNQLGSASSVLDPETGAVSAILSQLPYGAEEQTLPRVDPGDPGAFAPRYEFTGKERDRGVGLVYFGARSLAPPLGRWASADPVATHESTGLPFAYVQQNPVRMVDPAGLWSEMALSHFGSAAASWGWNPVQSAPAGTGQSPTASTGPPSTVPSSGPSVIEGYRIQTTSQAGPGAPAAQPALDSVSSGPIDTAQEFQGFVYRVASRFEAGLTTAVDVWGSENAALVEDYGPIGGTLLGIVEAPSIAGQAGRAGAAAAGGDEEDQALAGSIFSMGVSTIESVTAIAAVGPLVQGVGSFARWWMTGAENDAAWRSLPFFDKLLYEIGSNTLPEATWAGLRSVDPVTRGWLLVEEYGVKNAILSTSWTNFSATWSTGATPAVRYIVPRLLGAGAGAAAYYLWDTPAGSGQDDDTD